MSHSLKRLCDVARDINAEANSALGLGVFLTAVQQAAKFEAAWQEDGGKYIGETAMCRHCSKLIIVVDANAGQSLYQELTWKHVGGYFGCRAGIQPLAEPFFGEHMLIDDEEAYL